MTRKTRPCMDEKPVKGIGRYDRRAKVANGALKQMRGFEDSHPVPNCRFILRCVRKRLNRTRRVIACHSRRMDWVHVGVQSSLPYSEGWYSAPVAGGDDASGVASSAKLRFSCTSCFCLECLRRFFTTRAASFFSDSSVKGEDSSTSSWSGCDAKEEGESTGTSYWYAYAYEGV